MSLVATLAPTVVSRVALADADPSATDSVDLGSDGIAVPQTSGAAAAQGIASVDASGVAHATYAFELPPARGSVQPTLALEYSSNAGDGDAGIGWRLTALTLERASPARTSVPTFHDQDSSPDQAWDTYDTFTFQGRPLVPICSTRGGGCNSEVMPAFAAAGWWYYRLQVDDGSALRFFLSPDKKTWAIQAKTGEIMELGTPLDGQYGTGADVDPTSGVVFRWKLVRRYDNNRAANSTPTNPIVYLWNGPDGTLSDIYDTAGSSGRSTILPALSGFEHHTHLTWTANASYRVNPPVWRANHARQLLSHVDVSSWQDTSASRVMVRRYDLAYQLPALTSHHAQLIGISQEGQCSAPVVEANELLPATTHCPTLPATYLTYTNPIAGFAGAVTMSASSNVALRSLADLTSDGLPDILEPVFFGSTQQHNYTLRVNHGATGFAAVNMTIPPAYDPALVTGAGWGSGGVVLGDWLGDGRPNLAAYGRAPWARDEWANQSAESKDPPSALSMTIFTPKQAADGTWSWLPVPGNSMAWDMRIQNDPAALGILMCSPVDVNGDGLTDCFATEKYWSGDNSTGNYHYIDDGFLFAQKGRSGNIVYPLPPGAGMASHAGYPLSAASGYSVVSAAATKWAALVKDRATNHGWATQNDGYYFADFDGDGLTDLLTLIVAQTCVTVSGINVCGNMAARSFYFYRGHGDGTFGEGGCFAGVCDPGLRSPTGLISFDSLLPASVPNDWPSGEHLPINPAEFNFYFHDLNGDGLADMIVGMKDQVDVLFNQDAAGFAAPIQLFPGQQIPEWKMIIDDDAEQLRQQTQILFADMNGSGVDDLVLVGSQVAYVDFFTGNAALTPNLLRTVENGKGAKTTFSYASTAMLPANGGTVPQPMQVVTRVEMTNGLVGPNYVDQVTSYDYAGPVYDARERQFRGFRQVTATQRGGGSSAPGSRTTTTYAIGSCPVDAGSPCAEGVDNAYESVRGLPVVVEVADETGKVYGSSTHTTYNVRPLYLGSDGRMVRLVYAEQTDTFLYDTSGAMSQSGAVQIFADIDDASEPRLVTSTSFPLRATTNLAHLRSTQHLDNHGNLDLRTNYGRLADLGNTTADAPSTTATYFIQQGAAGSWMWKPLFTGTSAGVTFSRPDSLHAQAFAYDANGNLIEVHSFLAGTLALARRHEDATAAMAPSPSTQSKDGVIVSLHLVLDAFGNATHAETPDGGCVDAAYDTKWAHFPATSTRYVGTSSSGCGPTALKTYTTFDRGFGLPLLTSGASNNVSLISYDGFGRVSAAYEADPTLPGVPSALPSVKFDYPLPVVTAQGTYRLIHAQHIVGATGTYASTWSYLDGFDQAVVTLTEADPAAGDAGNWVATGQTSDAINGRPLRAYAAAFWGGTDPTKFPYTATPTQASETYQYDAFGRRTERFGTDGKTSLLKVVPHALSTELWDAEDLRVGGAHASTPTVIARDGFGRTSTVVSKSRSGGGQLDTITTTATYRATGELIELDKTHALGGGLFRRSMTYDTLGRVVSNWEPNSSQVTTAGGNYWRYAYDDAGHLVGTSDARGCGKNIFYDNAGRTVGEDFSPCQKNQLPYTAPNLTTGDGTEAFYQYDGAGEMILAGGASLAAATGRLSVISDRGAQTKFYYDGRGRLTQLTRSLAKPGAPNATLASRFAPHTYSQLASYDLANRAVTQTTGADADGLLGAGAQSQVTTAYSLRSLVNQVQGSYGPLVTNAKYDADGSPLVMTYGDLVGTMATYQYQTIPSTLQMVPFKALQRFTVSRKGGPWAAASATYPLPPTSPQPTTQSILLDDFFSYDWVGNPIEIDDLRPASEWPAGAKPVTKRTLAYDDSYRLANVGYAHGGDASISFGDVPNAIPTVARTKRVQSQTFVYDWLGNTTSTDDDASTFFERSLGTITNGTTSPNQLVSAKGVGTNGLGAVYDAAGNTVSLVVQRTDAGCSDTSGKCTQRYDYTWDEVGRLAEARRWDYAGAYPGGIPTKQTASPTSVPAADLAYAYDASNNRVLKTSTASAGALYDAEIFGSLRLNRATWSGTDYQHDATTEGAYLVSGGTAIGRVVYNPHDMPAVRSGTQHVFLEITDHVGSTSVVIDRDSSELVEKSTYQAYGAMDTDYRPARWDSYREDYRFTGKEDDSEVGLTYFGQRYYSSGLGRWLSPDPLAVHALGADLNPYAYVSGSPVRYFDPLGLDGSDSSDSEDTPSGDDAAAAQRIDPNGLPSGGVIVTRAGNTIDIFVNLYEANDADHADYGPSSPHDLGPGGMGPAPERQLGNGAAPSAKDIWLASKVLAKVITMDMTGAGLWPKREEPRPTNDLAAEVQWELKHHGFMIGGMQPIAAVAEEGFIYLRRDMTGGLKDYVGQAESEAHFALRQAKHAANYPNASFEFHVLDRAPAGGALDVAEESWIRAGGGPTNKANPNGGLSNGRYQMNDAAYKAAGGTVPLPGEGD